VSLPPSKRMSIELPSEAHCSLWPGPFQIVELTGQAIIATLPDVLSKRVLAAPPVIVSPETPAIVSLPPLPPWIVSPTPSQIVSLPPLPPVIVWPGAPPIVSWPPLPPRIVSPGPPQIVSVPPVPPKIDWFPRCPSRN